MLEKTVLRPILYNEALTRGLGDPESSLLIDWLVEQAELQAGSAASEEAVAHLVTRLAQRARSIGRFVGLWCYENAAGAAVQLAGTERLYWPLPNRRKIDPCELMHRILTWESGQPTPAVKPPPCSG